MFVLHCQLQLSPIWTQLKDTEINKVRDAELENRLASGELDTHRAAGEPTDGALAADSAKAEWTHVLEPKARILDEHSSI